MTIKTTHVGSLPRPQELTELLFSIEKGIRVEESSRDELFQKETNNALAKQKEAGISIPSDGEMSKISYATYIGRRVSGFQGDSPRQPPADLEAFPSFLKRLAAAGGTPSYKRPMCVNKLGEYKPAELKEDIARLKNAMAASGYQDAFMNSASPGVIAQFQPSSYYKSREEYLTALAEVMSEEYRAIIDAGLYLQIDAPDLALGRHMTFKNLSDEEFIAQADFNIGLINEAISGLPREKVRLHICWGNYEGPHHCDIEVQKLFPAIFRLKVGALLFESANPRHEHEWAHWKDAAIPEDLVLIPGVIDSTSNFVEHPELVAQRLRRFVDIVGRDRVIGGSDCGFATFAGFGTVDEHITYAKLKSLAEGAALV